MTLKEYINHSLLKLGGIDDSLTELNHMIKKATGYNDTDLILNRNTVLEKEVYADIDCMIEARLSGKPLQYILGEWDFYSNTFKVNENVLIPRPETEQLCEYVINQISTSDKPVVADLCSGSGCIGITIKDNKSDADVYLFEKSEAAAECCRENINRILGSEGVQLKIFDIFDIDTLDNLPQFDVIVSNPPYISSDEIKALQSEVLREPEMALDGGEDGLDFYRLIINKWTRYLKNDGFVAFECGEEQANDIKYMFEEKSFCAEILNDFNNIERFVIGKRRK